MRFGAIAVDEAKGAILGHNVVGSDGRRALRKGKALDDDDLEVLRDLGRSSIFAAVLEPGDVDENDAAERVTRAVVGGSVRLTGPATGRVNVHAAKLGLVRVAVDRLAVLNARTGVTLATRGDRSAAAEGKMIGTIKILPYALPGETVEAIESEGVENGPLLSLEPLPERRIGLIVSANPSSRDKIVVGFESALRRRIESLGSRLERIDFVPLEAETEGALGQLAAALGDQKSSGVELILLAGETAIQDRHDLAPSAVEAAGGSVECFGAPVDPGNLLMLGHLGDVAVMGAPGCARSPKTNIVDLLLPRLLAGERVTQADVLALGHGGLLEDVPERPLPRSRI